MRTLEVKKGCIRICWWHSLDKTRYDWDVKACTCCHMRLLIMVWFASAKAIRYKYTCTPSMHPHYTTSKKGKFYKLAIGHACRNALSHNTSLCTLSLSLSLSLQEAWLPFWCLGVTKCALTTAPLALLCWFPALVPCPWPLLHAPMREHEPPPVIQRTGWGLVRSHVTPRSTQMFQSLILHLLEEVLHNTLSLLSIPAANVAHKAWIMPRWHLKPCSLDKIWRRHIASLHKGNVW